MSKLDYRGVIARVADTFKLPVSDMIGRSRLPAIVRVRSAASWIMAQMTIVERRESGDRFKGVSAKRRGEMLGGRDHSTVLNLDRHAENLRGRDPIFCELTDQLLAAELTGTAAALRPIVPVSLIKVVAVPQPEMSDRWQRSDAAKEARRRIAERKVRPCCRLSPDEMVAALPIVRGTVLLERALRKAAA